ncbi:MAG: response regulator transcription factor [Deltaproteobacteria bacterium]|nr:response regulator transcription factor [Deltaproteobacteria bacterium]
MAKTLLAVDDSTTMRKVLEITFSGEDFRVITAENAQAALGKLGENPGVFVVDTTLGGEDGYALAKELRKRSPGAPIIMLASRYAPYDQARGRDAGADDYADKPFDTQQLIDKVRKVILAKEASGSAPAPMVGGAPAAAGAPYRAPAPPAPAPAPAPAPMAAAPAVPRAGTGTAPSLSGSAQSSQARTGTLVFGEGSGSPVPPPAAPRPAPVAAPAPQVAVAAAVNGHLSGKLGELGLTPQQAEAVMALSRDVVERVVWEVVPQLAETLIKEEIQRLMKE